MTLEQALAIAEASGGCSEAGQAIKALAEAVRRARPAAIHAAELLEAEAEAIRECHTAFDAPDDWTGEDEAKADYEEMRATAAALRDALPAAPELGR